MVANNNVGHKYIPHQGDIVIGNFSPTRGHEQHGWRPALVISQQVLSDTSPFAWVLPISHGKYEHPMHVKLDDRTMTDGTIYVEQIRSVDYVERHFKFYERVPQDILNRVLKNVKGTI
ncbi:type II toxin-antitoxin system PemK/MazF family toxin [Lactiplantibacillus fabifermentans]|uniref:Transcriptional regulator n=1 Tax=Lactiplantibacillus fabifermentans T30PCM01 TaxID=1400520 RepID=W6T8Y3_9LACO|nr:type II toxin-antitoxin system PemK/MazF family toxin [Lactiplantibacillus fabifermentans]ETY74837.1 transcriptional regulator [Lactiplantibacillus fabifermentans T30PCM01]